MHMAKFKPLTVIDLDDERTKPTHNGWKFCFRLSDDTTEKWDELFDEVQSRRWWWQPLMFASNGRITLSVCPLGAFGSLNGRWRSMYVRLTFATCAG